MEECVLVAADVDKGGVESGHDFADFSDKDVADAELFRGGFAVEFHQALVLQQGNLHTVGVVGND